MKAEAEIGTRRAVTLVELLVVIGGVAVVGVVLYAYFAGHLGAGKDRRDKNELVAVQQAVHAMMDANGLTSLPRPVTGPTNDMSAFPDLSVCGREKKEDRGGAAFSQGGDRDGYVLYQHDSKADGESSGLVNYFSRRQTACWYSVTEGGAVIQAREAPAQP